MNTAINAFSDFTLALFPVSFIKTLQLQLHKKVVLCLLMGCGVLLVYLPQGSSAYAHRS